MTDPTGAVILLYLVPDRGFYVWLRCIGALGSLLRFFQVVPLLFADLSGRHRMY
ncbi:MAG TPA: hypothetical protein VGS41_11535 [Chthonomonadales bacterium]|nr:hypothetical protein [Chthonomonadales bacterium]